MAGGTGGHVYPAMSVAKHLIANDVDIIWVGTKAGIEDRIVKEAGIKMTQVNMTGFAGKGIYAKLKAILLLSINTLRFIYKFIIRRPSAVIGFGGYVSLPGSFAAKALFIPVLLHEQNSRIGVANKIINKISDQSLLAFKGALKGKNVVFTGNPVRNEICELKDIKKTYTDTLNVLVLGGSLGAKYFNENIMNVFDKEQNINVIHQCGQYDLEEIRRKYSERGLDANVVKYIDDIAAVYKGIDLVICRAGAMTVSELMCAAIPAIYIPFPYAIYNHQYHNAVAVNDIGGGFVVNEDDKTTAAISEIISSILSDMEIKLGDMRKKLLEFNYKSGTKKIAEHCLEYC
jgi:UDP-N-acetylglucosamine--N-acetylmuramyl-(pentapeptide) pyrophosphoryl-undecaprenol N-acetylglucosamine transferase